MSVQAERPAESHVYRFARRVQAQLGICVHLGVGLNCPAHSAAIVYINVTPVESYALWMLPVFTRVPGIDA